MADLGLGLFTPPVDVREKERQREAAAAPEVDPHDRPAQPVTPVNREGDF